MQSRLTAAIAVGLALMVSACAGFTPLYAEPGVTPALRSIEVRTPDSRPGYILRESLEDAFGRDLGRAPAYRLDAEISERRAPLGRRADDTATRYELVLTVAYVVTALPSGERVHADTINVTTTYAASDQPYAGVVANQDGVERAAAQAADLIRGDLGRVFADRARAG
jgi:LPS-assembly lipoprotein